MHSILLALRFAVPLAVGLAVLPPPAAQGAQEGGARYYREQGSWMRVDPHGVFRVNPEVISARFAVGLTSLDELRKLLGELDEAGRALLEGLEVLRTNVLGIHDLRVAPGSDVLEVVAFLRATGLCDFVEENTFGTYLAGSGDPDFAQQWGLHNSGQTGGTPGADVGALAAWAHATGDPAIVIAVLDSGTEITHPDLAPNVWINLGEIPGNGIDDDGNGFIDDVYGWDFYNDDSDVTGPFDHGTAVTGIIGARTGDGIGIAGLAGGQGALPGCRTMAVAVGDFFPDASILDDAILYAVHNGARVVTMSLTVGQSMAIDAALEYAWNDRNVFVDCASGNSGSTVGYPARHPSVVACAATDHDDQRPSWSGSGPENWIAAPGVNVYTTSTGGGYTTTSGTSFAAPHVAAAAGLIYSLLPYTSNESVKEILRLSAHDVLQPGFDEGSGHGRLDAAAAVQLAAEGDCNGNGIWDTEDVASGGSADANGNGIPDECECLPAVSYCTAAPSSLGPGAIMSHAGSASVAQNDLVLLVAGASAKQPGIFYYGSVQTEVPFGDGFRCVSGAIFRLPAVTTDLYGDASYALDLSSPPQPAGAISAGETWNFQYWFRDPLAGGVGFNLSDGLAVHFCL